MGTDYNTDGIAGSSLFSNEGAASTSLSRPMSGLAMSSTTPPTGMRSCSRAGPPTACTCPTTTSAAAAPAWTPATGTNGSLYVKEYVGGDWGSSWTLIDGPPLQAGVSAMLDVYGHQHVFASGTDGAVYNIRNAAIGADGKHGSWNFYNIGGTVLTKTPGVNYFPATNEYDVYATGTNGHLYEKDYVDGNWAGSWSDRGDHNLAGGAAAMVDKYGHQHVFAIATGHVMYNSRNTSGSSWTWGRATRQHHPARHPEAAVRLRQQHLQRVGGRHRRRAVPPGVREQRLVHRLPRLQRWHLHQRDRLTGNSVNQMRINQANQGRCRSARVPGSASVSVWWPAPNRPRRQQGNTMADQTAYDFFLGKGLTDVQAAGIVGNFEVEAPGMDPTAVQPNGPGRGIAQWSVGGRWDTSSQNNVVWYANAQNESRYSLRLQLEFTWYELTSYSSYGLASLRAATTVSAAEVAFQDNFEGCGSCDQSRRTSIAQVALSAFDSDIAPDTEAGMTVGAGSYQHIFVTTSTGAVAERYETSAGWGWASIGGTILTGNPAVNYFPDDNEYDVYATGTNGSLYVKEYVGGNWGSSWTLIDGPALRAGVSAIVDKYGNQHVFATGTDGAVYNIRNATTGADGKQGSWNFYNIGGTILTKTPAVTYFAGSNVYDVYATGTNGHLYVKEYSGGNWDGSWTDLGDHNFTSGVSAMVDGYGHQHVFAVNDSHAIVNVRNTIDGSDGDNGSWSYDSIDGTILTGTPKLQYLPGSNVYNVWAAGTDGELYHKAYDGNSWWPSYHDFSGGTSINATG